MNFVSVLQSHTDFNSQKFKLMSVLKGWQLILWVVEPYRTDKIQIKFLFVCIQDIKLEFYHDHVASFRNDYNSIFTETV